ncbi:hypothetical protein H0W26_05500 [Candidatus Dependentiae bacterium]|nr:hypothetical protein [Candidatus Dependentiae bacterium]
MTISVFIEFFYHLLSERKRCIIYGSLQSRAICSKVLKGHTSAGSSLVFSPDGTTVFTRSEDATACLWISNAVPGNFSYYKKRNSNSFNN